MTNKKYNYDEKRYEFDPSESKNTVTFYLHKGKQGFTMEISENDKDKLEEILKNNKINHTIEQGNVLPF